VRREARLHTGQCCAAAQSLSRLGPRWQVPSARRRHGWPSAADAATRGDLLAQPMVAVAVAVAVAVQGVRTPTMPVVALSASCVRRADVRPMVGRPSAVHVSGVQRDRCDLDVRTDTCPVSEASASALSVVCPTQARPKRRWPYTAPRASTAGLAAASPARGCGATLAAWSTNRAVQREGARPVGLEARQKASTDKSSRRCVLGRLPGGGPTTGPNQKVVTTLRGRRGGGGAALPSGAGSLRVGGEECGRSAAAAHEERCPPRTDSALTSENCGGRDRV
jgi:hypothetical protein